MVLIYSKLMAVKVKHVYEMKHYKNDILLLSRFISYKHFSRQVLVKIMKHHANPIRGYFQLLRVHAEMTDVVRAGDAEG